MLLVTKKETLRSVEAKGAKFVEMSDLFAHELWCINLCGWTPPRISQKFPKTSERLFTLLENIKGNEPSRTGDASTRNPDSATQSGLAQRWRATLHCCARLDLAFIFCSYRGRKTVEVGIILAQKLFLHQHFDKEPDVGSAGRG